MGMFRSLLVANRGEIARRIIRTARRMGLRTIAVATEADRSWPHWREADEAVFIGSGPASESYLSIERIVAAARDNGADALHPGYGFLSENADFAQACADAGLIFVGPPAAAIRAMGSKAEAKRLMVQAGVPVVPGYHGERQETGFLRQKAYEIGYPLLVKAVAGGGGRGMRRVDRAVDFDAALESARREAQNAFGDDRVLLERYVVNPRHIEIQVFADASGRTIHLGERDCSVQRRHQKVIEEAPAPGMSAALRTAMGQAAVRAAEAVGYRGAGTVEFVLEPPKGEGDPAFFFLEKNTRLQVEHPVTEMVRGLDLVEWQIRIAAGEALPVGQEDVRFDGHAVEVRLYAEDPRHDFRPSSGRIWAASFPEGPGLRVDSGVAEGTVVSPFYDSMLGKVIAHGADRAEALARLGGALAETAIAGPKTNIAFLSAVTGHPEFAAGGVDTGFLDRILPVLALREPAPGSAAAVIAGRIAAEAAQAAERVRGPWARADAFELTGLRRRQTLAVEIEGGPAEAIIAWREGGPDVVELDGTRIEPAPPSTVVWGDKCAFVLADGEQLAVGFPDALDRALGLPVDGGIVHAPMHGRVLHVAVAVGDIVAQGAPLFALEAMKMEHTLVAPIAGRVSEVRIAPGEQVEESAVAILIEPTAEAEAAAGEAAGA